MSDLVDADEIERIVGAKRHASEHMIRLVSETETAYILHSFECLNTHEDLRNCPLSLALDNDGLMVSMFFMDEPVYVEEYSGQLIPKTIL